LLIEKRFLAEVLAEHRIAKSWFNELVARCEPSARRRSNRDPNDPGDRRTRRPRATVELIARLRDEGLRRLAGGSGTIHCT
jgi:hypothetical protein